MTVNGHVWVCACRIAFDLSWERWAFHFWSPCQEWGSSLFLQNVWQHLSGEVSVAVRFVCFSLKGTWNGCNFFIPSTSFLQVPLLLKICPCLFTFWVTHLHDCPTLRDQCKRVFPCESKGFQKRRSSSVFPIHAYGLHAYAMHRFLFLALSTSLCLCRIHLFIIYEYFSFLSLLYHICSILQSN